MKLREEILKDFIIIIIIIIIEKMVSWLRFVFLFEFLELFHMLIFSYPSPISSLYVYLSPIALRHETGTSKAQG